MNSRDIHTPVLLDRCVELLAPALERDGAVFVDATLGMGGHSEAFLERFPGLRLVGLDRDQDALRIAGERLARFGDRVTLVHTVYDGIADAVASAGFAAADGILFDLGVSSLQLDVADRGFAYSKDAPLDMRMDQTAGTTAADVLATYGEGDLRRIFERYGEEKLSGRYARAIIAARAEAPIERSGRLVEILQAATPYAAQRTGHPAKRVFQALRIEVNRELSVLEHAIPSALGILPVGGRIVVLAYQSLEDRIVKRVLAA
jgi:16S rRNA (cytosine1402-N4)-methyltransferase